MSLQLTFYFLSQVSVSYLLCITATATYGQAQEARCPMFLSREPNLGEPGPLLGYIKRKEPRKSQKHFASHINLCTIRRGRNNFPATLLSCLLTFMSFPHSFGSVATLRMDSPRCTPIELRDSKGSQGCV